MVLTIGKKITTRFNGFKLFSNKTTDPHMVHS
jgi:hypothetical protein